MFTNLFKEFQMTEYKIVFDTEIKGLEIVVENHMNDFGWKPMGGPFIDKNGNYCQAMGK
jgi:hypothetical protein